MSTAEDQSRTADRTPSPFTETTGSARHAAFAELAATGPVQRVTLFTGVTVYLITGYDEVRAVLSNPNVAKSPGEVPHREVTPPELSAAINSSLLSANPPDHTRMRRLVTAAFTRRRIEALEPRVVQIAAGFADEMAAAAKSAAKMSASPVDLVALFGYPLPITVITELVGVPMADRDEFRRWSSIVTSGPAYSAEVYISAARSMVEYTRALIDAKRAAPADDLLSDLIRARDDGDRLTDDELTSTLIVLMSAGHETTVNLIGTAVHTLLSQPGRWAEYRDAIAAGPSSDRDSGDRAPGDRVLNSVVEEVLRYDSPVQVTIPAVTLAPVDVGGVRIPAGEVVVPVLIAANRDSRRFDDPATFQPAAPDSGASNQHVAFGHGIHHCLGAPLARMEGRVALRTLLERFPDLRLAEPDHEPARAPSLLLNGLRELPVLLR